MPTAQVCIVCAHFYVCVVCVELWCYWQRTTAKGRTCAEVEHCCTAVKAGDVGVCHKSMDVVL